MKRWSLVFWLIIVSLTVVAEVMSWALPALAWRYYPSWVCAGVLASVLPWPRSLYVAAVLGGVIDLFAPAPFGVWLLALILLVMVSRWVKSTWLKQTSVLSVAVAVWFGMMAATLPVWFWLVLAWRSAVISPVIQLVPWWQWPISWLVMSMIVAVLAKMIPSPYERLL